MHYEKLREACLSLLHVTEDFPFDQHTLVMRVGNKIFAFLPLEKTPAQISLKMTPENVLETRAQYPAVEPGWHLNKKFWNQVIMDGSIDPEIIVGWIKDSYGLIFASLPKKVQAELQ